MTIDELTELAVRWHQAERNAVVGMGSASGRMIESAMDARQQFVEGLKQVRPGAIADVLIGFRRAERRAREMDELEALVKTENAVRPKPLP